MALPEHWHHRGDPQALPLLFLHGFMGSAQDWDFALEALASEYYCLAPDLPGHGQNPDPIAALPQIWQGLSATLQAQGLQRFGVLGYSLGGRLAQAGLAQEPERFRALILASAATGLPAAERTSRRAADATRAQTLENGDFKAFLEAWYRQPLFGSLVEHPGYPALLQRRLQQTPARLAEVLRRAGAAEDRERSEALTSLQRYAKKTGAVLYLAGREDAKYAQWGAELARLIPELRFQLLPGGHSAHVEAPEAWLQAVRAFLGDVAEQAL